MKDLFDVSELPHNGSSLPVHSDEDFINLIQGILSVCVLPGNWTHDLGDVSTRFNNYGQHSYVMLVYKTVSDKKII